MGELGFWVIHLLRCPAHTGKSLANGSGRGSFFPPCLPKPQFRALRKLPAAVKKNR